ncbi:MAG: hypothetical protein HYT28_01565 [Parcubacteria group bacterium]|nr:hypothetical protein [Parcubacteria group bacterium]
MKKYPEEQTRIHAIVLIDGSKDYDPETVFVTKCGRKILFKNVVKSNEVIKHSLQCNTCYQASRNQLTLPRGWKIIYLHE